MYFSLILTVPAVQSGFCRKKKKLLYCPFRTSSTTFLKGCGLSTLVFPFYFTFKCSLVQPVSNVKRFCVVLHRWWIDQCHLFLDLQQGQINIFLPTPGLPKATTCWLLNVISKSANQQTTSGLESRSPFTLTHGHSDHKTASCLWLIHIRKM